MSQIRKRGSVKNVIKDKVVVVPKDKEQTVMAIVSKALTSEADWTDKDEFLDVIYWIRQIMGVVIGVVWGIMPLKGIIGLLLFFAINTLVVYLYFSSFQKIDEEEYGGFTEILKEGLMTSFSSFLVSWIILYSAIHYDSILM